MVRAEDSPVDEEAAPFAGVERLDRATLVAAVLARNPDLAAAQAAYEAARQRVPQATALDDPQLAYGIAPLSVFSDTTRFGNTVEARQMLPYPGKRKLRGEAAEARAEAAGERYAEARLDLARLAADLLDDLYLVDRSLEINRDHVRLLEELKEAATNRYAAGLVPQQAPLQAEVELTHLVHRDVTLGTQRGVVVARLNALLHRPPASPLPPPAPLDEAGPPLAVEGAATSMGADDHDHAPAVDPARLGALMVRAIAARPELAAADAEVRARQVERELAGLARRPDFGVMGTYSSMWPETAHQWMLGVSVNLPVRRQRIAAGEAEADAELAAAAARREAAATAVRSEVAQAADLLVEMDHVVDLYDSRLLPAANDQLRAARSGFETGKVEFMAVVEAERNLRSVRLGYEEALTDRHRRLAALERAVGVEPGGILLAAAPAADSAADDSETASEAASAASPHGPAASAAGGTR